jgi:UDP-N-acetylmuramate dehydrogenase
MKVFQENELLAPYTTFGIGGATRYMMTIGSLEELREAAAFAIQKNSVIVVLGGGSNMLVSDNGFEGLVIKNEIKGIVEKKEGDTVFVEAGAGESWDDLVAYAVQRGYGGLENLSAIPGTVGAAPIQNIGAYGVEVKSVIESVKVFDPFLGQEKVFSNADCAFSYRDSMFKHPDGKHLIVTSVVFRLSASFVPNLSYKDVKEYFAARNNTTPSIQEVRDAVTEIRRGKFPDLSEVGTAGSFWKNPIVSVAFFEKLATRYPDMPSFEAGEGLRKIPLAWILDRVCKLKGYAYGKARLFERQPLVVVAEKGASFYDVQACAEHVEDVVLETTGIDIEKEVFVLE